MEQFWRRFAAHHRRVGFLLNASECDLLADLLALADLDPSADVCGWSAVAALAGEA